MTDKLEVFQDMAIRGPITDAADAEAIVDAAIRPSMRFVVPKTEKQQASEPFLSMGARWATDSHDRWTLLSDPRAPTFQYEHTVVATRNGPLVVTLPG